MIRLFFRDEENNGTGYERDRKGRREQQRISVLRDPIVGEIGNGERLKEYSYGQFEKKKKKNKNKIKTRSKIDYDFAE